MEDRVGYCFMSLWNSGIRYKCILVRKQLLQVLRSKKSQEGLIVTAINGKRLTLARGETVMNYRKPERIFEDSGTGAFPKSGQNAFYSMI